MSFVLYPLTGIEMKPKYILYDSNSSEQVRHRIHQGLCYLNMMQLPAEFFREICSQIELDFAKLSQDAPEIQELKNKFERIKDHQPSEVSPNTVREYRVTHKKGPRESSSHLDTPTVLFISNHEGNIVCQYNHSHVQNSFDKAEKKCLGRGLAFLKNPSISLQDKKGILPYVKDDLTNFEKRYSRPEQQPQSKAVAHRIIAEIEHRISIAANTEAPAPLTSLESSSIKTQSVASAPSARQILQPLIPSSTTTQTRTTSPQPLPKSPNSETPLPHPFVSSPAMPVLATETPHQNPTLLRSVEEIEETLGLRERYNASSVKRNAADNRSEPARKRVKAHARNQREKEGVLICYVGSHRTPSILKSKEGFIINHAHGIFEKKAPPDVIWKINRCEDHLRADPNLTPEIWEIITADHNRVRQKF